MARMTGTDQPTTTTVVGEFLSTAEFPPSQASGTFGVVQALIALHEDGLKNLRMDVGRSNPVAATLLT